MNLTRPSSSGSAKSSKDVKTSSSKRIKSCLITGSSAVSVKFFPAFHAFPGDLRLSTRVSLGRNVFPPSSPGSPSRLRAPLPGSEVKTSPPSNSNVRSRFLTLFSRVSVLFDVIVLAIKFHKVSFKILCLLYLLSFNSLVYLRVCLCLSCRWSGSLRSSDYQMFTDSNAKRNSRCHGAIAFHPGVAGKR